MDLEITISMRASEMRAKLAEILEQVESAITNGDEFEHTFYGTGEDGGDVILHFDNEDMERPEMSGKTIVVVDEQP